MRLGELGEDGLLAELERRGLVQEIADDGAQLGGGLVVTQDVLLEGVHFRLEWTSLRDLGYKAAAVNLSDLAALGAEPTALLVSVAAPPETDAAEVVELYEGLNEPDVPIVGGDTTRADALALVVTALGHSERVPGRAGARAGDVLVVTGPLGGAAAGLHALGHGLSGHDAHVERHRRPPLRLAEGRRLARTAHALMDLSDGIAADAARMAARSGVRIVVDVDRLPLAESLPDRDEPFWTRGEDYELLAALAPDDPLAAEFAVVGRCEPGEGVELRRAGGPVDARGWDPFSSP
jgi:thiamine-monophosphate kinase